MTVVRLAQYALRISPVGSVCVVQHPLACCGGVPSNPVITLVATLFIGGLRSLRLGLKIERSTLGGGAAWDTQGFPTATALRRCLKHRDFARV